MQAIAFLVVAAAGLWLIGVSALMALRPCQSLDLLDRMSRALSASDWRLNSIEQGLRVLAGAALIARAPSSKLPWLFEVAGCLLVATSVLILALPVRWHGAYGVWLSKRLGPGMVRALSPVPAVMGTGLLYIAA